MSESQPMIMPAAGGQHRQPMVQQMQGKLGNPYIINTGQTYIPQQNMGGQPYIPMQTLSPTQQQMIDQTFDNSFDMESPTGEKKIKLKLEPNLIFRRPHSQVPGSV